MDTIQPNTNAEVVVDTVIEVVDEHTAKEIKTETIVTETIIDLESIAKDIEATQSAIAGLEAYKTAEIASRNADIARFTQIQDEKIAELQSTLTSLQAKEADLRSRGLQDKPEPVIPIPAEELPVNPE